MTAVFHENKFHFDPNVYDSLIVSVTKGVLMYQEGEINT